MEEKEKNVKSKYSEKEVDDEVIDECEKFLNDLFNDLHKK